MLETVREDRGNMEPWKAKDQRGKIRGHTLGGDREEMATFSWQNPLNIRV